MSDILSTAQQAIKARLESDGYFKDAITVLTEEIGDLANEVARRAAKFGICAVVLTPSLAQTGEPGQAKITIAVSIYEHVVLNRGRGTKKPATEAALRAAACLFRWAAASFPGCLFALPAIQLDAVEPLLVYRVECEMPINLTSEAIAS